MRDKADAWQMEIASITWEFKKITKNLSSANIQYKPAPNTWSIAENLSHLIQINSSYFPIFDQVLQETYSATFLAQLPYVPDAIGQLLHRSMTSKIKMTTFRQWRPSENLDEMVPLFKDHQMELSNYVQKLEPFVEKGTIIHSPASRWLPYRLDQAIDTLVAHEKRHLNQCKNLIQVLPKK